MARSILPLALYVHIPWCVRKCPYCDFNSHQKAVGTELPEDRYIDALLGDLEHDLAGHSGRELVSIFIGGGTPSLFSPHSFAKLLSGIRSRISCVPDLEVTLEANPGTIEHGKFAAYREAGINRVSLGVQSFDAKQLKLLGRIHSPDDVVRAVDELKTAGLDNFNLDLMYALPGQSTEQALADLHAALSLGSRHLSLYQLTLEPGTVFHHRPPEEMPDPEASWDIQMACQSLLQERGFAQYEVSAYALAGRQCRHNVNYWKFGDYLGIGAGAHGKVTDEAGRVMRTLRQKPPRQYLDGADATARLDGTRAVDPRELPFEFMLNALRLREGFTMREFEAGTGLPGTAIAATLALGRERGLLVESGEDGWSPSDLGWRFLNDLQALFLP